MKNIKFIVYLLLTFFVLACQDSSKKLEEKNEKIAKPLNPNGDSELALLMREMYEEAEKVKSQIKSGEKISLTLNHAKILTAHATEPEKAKSAEFKGFAKHYLSQVEALKKANKKTVDIQFKSLVESCMSCHQALCPGPMVRIKKLQSPIQAS